MDWISGSTATTTQQPEASQHAQERRTRLRHRKEIIQREVSRRIDPESADVRRIEAKADFIHCPQWAQIDKGPFVHDIILAIFSKAEVREIEIHRSPSRYSGGESADCEFEEVRVITQGPAKFFRKSVPIEHGERSVSGVGDGGTQAGQVEAGGKLDYRRGVTHRVLAGSASAAAGVSAVLVGKPGSRGVSSVRKGKPFPAEKPTAEVSVGVIKSSSIEG